MSALRSTVVPVWWQSPLSHDLASAALPTEAIPIRAAFVPEFNAFVRYVDLPGAKPPIVFLHGLGRSSVSLAQVATRDPLRGRRALLVDLLGFGISDKPDEFSYTLGDRAAAVIAVLDDVGAGPYAIVGHSLGGAVAVLVASRRPDLTAGVVVAEGNLDPGGAGMSLAIANPHGFAAAIAEAIGDNG